MKETSSHLRDVIFVSYLFIYFQHKRKAIWLAEKLDKKKINKNASKPIKISSSYFLEVDFYFVFISFFFFQDGGFKFGI